MYLKYFITGIFNNDLSDWILVVGGVAIVFTVLVLIYLFIKFVFPSVFGAISGMKTEKDKVKTGHPGNIKKHEGDIAAVAMVLYLHFSEMHDEESNVITIKRVSRTYSPWSSKLYSMRNRNF